MDPDAAARGVDVVSDPGEVRGSIREMQVLRGGELHGRRMLVCGRPLAHLLGWPYAGGGCQSPGGVADPEVSRERLQLLWRDGEDHPGLQLPGREVAPVPSSGREPEDPDSNSELVVRSIQVAGETLVQHDGAGASDSAETATAFRWRRLVRKILARVEGESWTVVPTHEPPARFLGRRS